MADQQFCLRWNNHQSTLISVFDTLLENGTLVDCTLAAEGQYLKAHKVVLSACSPYLETLLSQHYEKHPIVILKDVKFTELKSMMDYMYRGEVNISQDQLGTFLKAAESLQIKGLSDNGADGDARDVGSTPKAPPPRKATQPAPSNRPESSRPDSPLTDGSMSPSSRKRRRVRRSSQDDDSHLDSNSCDLPSQAQSTPVPNIPAASSSITTTPIVKPAIVKPEQTDINRIDSNSLPPEALKKEIEPISEPLLEPKTEYLEDVNNEDSVEDLTLDDDDDMDGMDISNMSNMSNMSRPGPSHGNDISNQGFAPWQLGANQSGTDEVFMAAQEAVNQHRDSQGISPVAAQREKTVVLGEKVQAKEDFGQNIQSNIPVLASRDITATQVTASSGNANELSGLNKSLDQNNEKFRRIKIRSDLFNPPSSGMNINDSAYKTFKNFINTKYQTEIKSKIGEGTGFEVTLESESCHGDDRTAIIQIVRSPNKHTTLSQAETSICDEISSYSTKEVRAKSTCVKTFGFEIEEEPERENSPNNTVYDERMIYYDLPSDEMVVPRTNSDVISADLLDSTSSKTTAAFSAEDKNRVTKRKTQSENGSQLKIGPDYAHYEGSLTKSISVLPLSDSNIQQITTSVSSEKTRSLQKRNRSTTVCTSCEPATKSVQKSANKTTQNVTLEATNLKRTEKFSSVPVNGNENNVTKNNSKPKPNTKSSEVKVTKKSNVQFDTPVGLVSAHSVIWKGTKKSNVQFETPVDLVSAHSVMGKGTRKGMLDDVSRRTTVVTRIRNCTNSRSPLVFDNHDELSVIKVKPSSVSNCVNQPDRHGHQKKSEKKLLEKKVTLRCEYCMIYFNNITQMEEHCIEKHSANNLFFEPQNKSEKKLLEKKDTLRCEYCMIYFNSISQMEEHCIEKHSANNLFFE